MIIRKIPTVIILWLLLAFTAACTGPPAADEPAAEEPVARESSEERAGEAGSEEPVKVALILAGSIQDEGWNQEGHRVLMEAVDNYGIEVSFQESVPVAEARDVIRNYAAEGYDLVIAHDLYFTDVVLEVAPDFPDTMFGISGGYSAEADNMVAVAATDWESTYLAGALAGLVTETNKVGILTATDSPIAQRLARSFELGAKEANPDVEASHAFVGSWDDVVKGKELVRSMVNQGVDVVYTQSGQVNVGAVEAAAEEGILAIGSIVDMSYVAPDTVVSSAVASPGGYVEYMISGYLDGTLEPRVYRLGIADGIEDLAPYHNFEDRLPQEVKDRVAEIRQQIIDGDVPEPTLD
ncbi:MAG TPA: BMP family protein [Candidatus Sulfomarinibacteraceae bacterium]|nr:BMP family protein [Candidatus Sulfomarinibacteraceae bacterium]